MPLIMSGMHNEPAVELSIRLSPAGGEVAVGEMLSVSEIPVDIRDDAVYPRLMVPSRIGSVRLRDTPPGGGIRRSWRWCVREGQFVLSMAKAHEGAYGAVPPECNGALI